MKKIFLCFSLVLLACEAPTKGLQQAADIPEIEILSSEPGLQKNGPFALFQEQKYSGYLVAYYEKGQLKSKTGYLNGLKEGPAVKYYEDGSLKEQRVYLDNRKHGRHLGWWPNGKPKFDYSFDQGLQQGESKEWYKSGRPFRFFTYLDGHENGSQKMWEENGKIRANYVVKGGHRYGLIGLKNCKSVSDEKGIYTARAY